MKLIVLDTNCLLMSLPKRSPYRYVWDAFLRNEYTLCVSNEILEEYFEIIAQKTTHTIAKNVLSTIMEQSNKQLIDPYFKFGLIHKDWDDNKFVDCAIVANAEYIVSEDSHFRILETIPFPKVKVIGLDDFLKELSIE